jgi:hypothetical protein
MRYLVISLCCFVCACGSYPKKQQFQTKSSIEKNIYNPYFSDADKDYVYKANINVYDNAFGGLLILKKIKNQEHRIVFTTEMGNKIFDFSFQQNAFKVNFILDDLNKPMLINILKKDFKVLLQETIEVNNAYTTANTKVYETKIDNKTYYYYFDKKLNKITRVSNGKEKVLFLFSEIQQEQASKIKIEHLNIKLDIHLRSIN